MLNETVSRLNPISLGEMDSIKLMERVDTKYVFKVDQIPEILSHLKSHYRILEVDGCRMVNYESLYYDTPTFDLYYKHHQGKMNRYKIRFRKYVESNLSFFEVKYKNNKSRTIKKRIKQDDIQLSLTETTKGFLSKHAFPVSLMVEATMYVYYKRLTLVNNNLTERVTIDIDLNYAKLNNQKVQFKNLAIVEIKQDKASKSEMALLLKKKHLRQGSISKYCLGIATLFDEVRKNNFKERINLLNKLQNDIAASA